MLDVTSENFEAEVVQSDKPVVIDFWAEWCGPCRQMAPTFKDLSEEMPNVKFVKVDVENANDLAQMYSISSIPTFVVTRAGNVLGHTIGAKGKNDIKAFIEKSIA